ncbi:BsuBI/PstI family type II restriction endonuclease [Methanoplanus endosymbiosus]|uniref:Uncharacterized protein n=1 Tax=Methanoplanus endosymbiosus TaxID=33865 RepID=A0A9E7TI74_9EURY|nr:BsuBI/PstI family type II restriction endonuclease [Methanoplanus endosymbiosus]UUX91993.1 hypothetical protein L6E24_11585 [Methanoplanus endosymbiosus]
MAKTDEALEILNKLGIPKAQLNDRSALTLLAIVGLKEGSDWGKAVQRSIIIHDIMNFIRENYHVDYAENSRETIRRQTIHQFEQAGLLIKNIDDPKRPTNSPKTDYAATRDLLNVLHSYGTDEFETSVDDFILNNGRLVDAYNKRRRKHQLTVNTEGVELKFSPGKHNQLQADIIQKLKPEFFSDAELLYVGDTSDKMLYLNEDLIQRLKFPVTKHDKLPDVVYYEEKRNLLFLIEAVTSHGPMTPKRMTEIDEALKDLDSLKIYMTAFPDKKTFKQHISDIAWETEVWISDNPEHMVHFNGPKFLTGI